ncbi:Dolichyl-phosphate-mannose-protein mannosyltransferase [Singulisphaera sp. GP187]|uniref:ArnT family glycosyltransferase n=1 Tax=Singulisphaera sp. GP187 TaxID=1882752 RepID=UPI0009292546|nr:glycosyltransferase family 39 protein [Singulisphaera sp. GP187]SIO59370.1 Dolichyl-phosphate-mannose-protein mannosyltransferase [Singulisphaera sp. GP187]
MSGRRSLLALVLLAAALHITGIARSVLPAQDGLKFLRTARDFQSKPWIDVVRGSDQHPLYPALVALGEPFVAAINGKGPNTWRIAAQAVAALASLALLIPLYGLTRTLFDARIAWVAVLIYVVLPLPAAIGHDTLSDSLALFAALLALWLGEISLRSSGWKAPLGCGLVAGLGFLARPEVLVVPLAVALTWITRSGVGVATLPRPRTRIALARLPALGLSFLVIVGAYALLKGEVSEKLALRQAMGMGPRKPQVRRAKQWLPPGLNDPRWDFAPKEESEEPAIATAPGIVVRLGLQWAECLCGLFAVFAVWGVARARFIRQLCAPNQEHQPTPDGEPSPPQWGPRLIAVYLALFSLVLFRHAFKMGYLSDRHTLTLVAASIPWAAAGTFVCMRGIAVKLRWSPRFARIAGAVAVLTLVTAGVRLQSKPIHPSRWGHWAAGRWLAAHTDPADAVLDTRGWAAFVSGRRSYDYWHVRQAFTDSQLRYVVVGTGELEAESRRAATLRAVLAYAADPVVEFPERQDGHGGAGVRVYRYRRPASWEGIRR